MSAPVLNDAELQKLYSWVDEIPLSRPKRNITRDFSDGVLLAEVVHHYFPKLVEIHNYSAASAVRQKMYNWATLNQKVFRRLGFQMEKVEIDSVVNCKPGAVELLLMRLQKHIADIRAGRKMVSSPTAAALPGSQQAIMDGPSGFEVQQQLQYPGASSHSMPAAMTAVHPAAAIAGGAGARGSMHAQQAVAAVDDAILAEKDATITELRETIEILELKIKKLEQLVRLKDSRIQTLTARLGAGASGGAQ